MFQQLLDLLGSRRDDAAAAAAPQASPQAQWDAPARARRPDAPLDEVDVVVTEGNVRERPPPRADDTAEPSQWVAWRLSHAHKHRCRAWVAARFPDATLAQNSKECLLFAARDAGAMVAALGKDEHAARHVHACAAHLRRTTNLEDVAALAEAAYDASNATAARLRVRGAPGLKQKLLSDLPDRIELRPRDATHELTVDAVPATHCTYYYVGCASLQEIFVGTAQLGDQGSKDEVCRAVHKLREAIQRFALKPFKRVIDVGAAPGGWSQVCLEHGAALVVAVDPAELDADVARGVTHVKRRLEDAETLRALGAAGGRFDAVLCDANAHPAKMAKALEPVLPYLVAGATLVLTLKQPSSATKAAHEDDGEVEAALAAARFRDLRSEWLWSNGRKERTLVATFT